MVKKNFSVTLDLEVVEQAQSHLEDEGAKLSPVINNLLKGWVKEMRIAKMSREEEEEEEEEQEEEEEEE